MTKRYALVTNDLSKREKVNLSFLNLDVAKKVHRYHTSFDQYCVTPLAELKNLAQHLGLKNVFVKDESHRFGLNAFKVLGGSYAIGKIIAEKLNRDIDELPYKTLISDVIRKELGDLTFISATDGNHGRGLAWTANKLKQKSYVYMPKGSSLERLNNILAEGAIADIKEYNYDDCVRMADEAAEKYGWIMVQDTAWEGYEKIPTWIMQGYMTMAYESYLQFELMNIKPTHVFLQAGVGSMAGAITGFLASVYGDERPIITIVEPYLADCLFQTAKALDGNLHYVTGDMHTIMAGLACGEPNKIGWEVLQNYADNFLSVSEDAAAHGMRVLGAPLAGDPRVISGESGAVTTGVVSQISYQPDLAEFKEALKLDENSVVYLISTEGNTDSKNYREIVWNGLYSNVFKIQR